MATGYNASLQVSERNAVCIGGPLHGQFVPLSQRELISYRRRNRHATIPTWTGPPMEQVRSQYVEVHYRIMEIRAIAARDRTYTNRFFWVSQDLSDEQAMEIVEGESLNKFRSSIDALSGCDAGELIDELYRRIPELAGPLKDEIEARDLRGVLSGPRASSY